MSTTVSYKGNTIATVNNNTKTLTTAGKYLEADVVLTDVTSGSTTVNPLSVTANGTYTAPTGTAYSPITVNVSSASEASDAVRFIDYDGTILHEYSKTEFLALTAMPANPSHTGLTSQGWNWSLSDAKTYVTNWGYLDIGQMYVTTSGATEIDIEIPEGFKRLSPYLSLAVNGEVSIDWGDGGFTDSLTGTSLTNTQSINHTYSTTGNYTIKIGTTTGSYVFYENSNCPILNNNNTSGNAYNTVYSSWIKRIRLGNGSTNMVSSYAFYNCYSLSSITIPSGVTKIGNSAFNSCYSLSSATISSGITSIGANAFQNCSALSSITIPSSVTSIGLNAFQNCYNLSSATISSGITSIGSYAFSACHSLSSVTIPSSITSIGTNAFSACYSLSSVTIPSGVTSIGNQTFYNCYSLSSVTIPSSITSIGTSAFSYCRALTSVTIPSGVTSISTSAFQSCYGMKEYHFLSETPPALSNTNALGGIPSDCIIYVPQGSLSAYQSATNWSTYASYMQEESN